MKILGIFREGFRASEIQKEEKRTGSKRAGDDNTGAEEQGKLNSDVTCIALGPDPYEPLVGCIQMPGTDADEESADW